jgi:hypothetical protein
MTDTFPGDLSVPGHTPVVRRIQDGLTNLIFDPDPLLIGKPELRTTSGHR